MNDINMNYFKINSWDSPIVSNKENKHEKFYFKNNIEKNTFKLSKAEIQLNTYKTQPNTSK